MSEDPRSMMEGRARRRASPAGMRTKAVRVEPEPPPPTRRHEPGTRVAVVYYLCRNHHLEHPHFMEVPLASPQGLYLRDVIGRLDALRGKGMAAKYSWSCKRSYKTGFVWHDLSADDLLLPTQGTEYVLKGSELPFDQSTPLPMPDHQQNNAACANNAKVQPCKLARQQESPRSPGSSNQGWTSKSPSPTPTTYPAVPVIKEEVLPPPPPPPPPPTARAAVIPAIKEHAVPPRLPRLVSLSSPSASTIGDDEQCRLPPHSGSSSNSSPKTSMASSSGTSSPSPTKPAAAGSDAATQTDDKAKWDDVKLQHRQDTARASSSQERPEIVVDEESRCTRAPAGENQPRSRRSGTLQSLIRAEAAGRRRCLPLPVEDDRAAAAATGGSVSGRLKPANLLMRLMACGPSHPGFGLVQTSSYKPCFPQLEYPSSPELCPLGAMKPAENCSGRLLDGALKRSSSSSRSHQEGVICEEEAWPKGFNNNLSRSASKRTSDPSSGRTASSSKVVSFRDE